MTAPTLIGPVLDEVLDNLTITEHEQRWDEDVPCIVGQPGTCERPAEWGLRCPLCGFDWHSCDPHRQAVDHGGYAGIRCARTEADPKPGCGGIMWLPLNWRPL